MGILALSRHGVLRYEAFSLARLYVLAISRGCACSETQTAALWKEAPEMPFKKSTVPHEPEKELLDLARPTLLCRLCLFC